MPTNREKQQEKEKERKRERQTDAQRKSAAAAASAGTAVRCGTAVDCCRWPTHRRLPVGSVTACVCVSVQDSVVKEESSVSETQRPQGKRHQL